MKRKISFLQSLRYPLALSALLALSSLDSPYSLYQVDDRTPTGGNVTDTLTTGDESIETPTERQSIGAKTAKQTIEVKTEKQSIGAKPVKSLSITPSETATAKTTPQHTLEDNQTTPTTPFNEIILTSVEPLYPDPNELNGSQNKSKTNENNKIVDAKEPIASEQMSSPNLQQTTPPDVIGSKQSESNPIVAQSASPPPAGQRLTTSASDPTKTVLINFNNVNVIEYIRFVSRISNRNFIFDENDLQFTVTIISEEPATVDNIMTALLQELLIHDLVLIEDGNNLIIHKNPKINAISKVISESLDNTYVRSDIITEVFRLNTLDSGTAATLLRPLVSGTALIESLKDSNQLIVTDIAGNVEKISQLLKSIDAPNSGVVIGQYVSNQTSIDILIPLIQQIMQPITQEQALTFVSQPSTNSIFIIGSPFLVERSIAILQYLDQDEGSTRILNLRDLRMGVFPTRERGGQYAPGTPYSGAPGTPGAGGYGTPGAGGYGTPGAGGYGTPGAGGYGTPGAGGYGTPGAGGYGTPGANGYGTPGAGGYGAPGAAGGYGAPGAGGAGGFGTPGSAGANGAPGGLNGAPGTPGGYGTTPGAFGTPGGAYGTPGGTSGTPGIPGGANEVPGGYGTTPFTVEPGLWELNPEGNWVLKPVQEPNQPAPPSGKWSRDYQGRWTFAPGEAPGPANEQPLGHWILDKDGNWIYELNKGESFSTLPLSRQFQGRPKLPGGAQKATQFFIYKLQYRKGESIEPSLRQIADTIQQNERGNEDLIAALRSVQLLIAQNSLVFSGTPQALDKIRVLVSEIDIPMRQVFIEMLILETSLADSLNYGVNYITRFGGGNTTGIQSFISGQSPLQGAISNSGLSNLGQVIGNQNVLVPDATSFDQTTGFNLGIIGQKIVHCGTEFGTIGALVSALHDRTKDVVVSNPKILVDDNSTAEIYVGINTPYRTQSIANDLGSIVTSNFEYRDVGTRLKVTPYIGNGDIVELDIEEEVSSIIAGLITNASSASTSPGPTTRIHRSTTRAHVPDTYFLIISGMMQDEESRERNQVPCLGGVPILGAAFSDKRNTSAKRNLMIFIRPQIIDTEEEVQLLTKHQQDIYTEKNCLQNSDEYETEQALDLMNINPTLHPEDYYDSCDGDEFGISP